MMFILCCWFRSEKIYDTLKNMLCAECITYNQVEIQSHDIQSHCKLIPCGKAHTKTGWDHFRQNIPVMSLHTKKPMVTECLGECLGDRKKILNAVIPQSNWACCFWPIATTKKKRFVAKRSKVVAKWSLVVTVLPSTTVNHLRPICEKLCFLCDCKVVIDSSVIRI